MKSRNIIIIPTYNEELNLGNLLEKLKNYFPDFFLLIIDDSPNDLTKKMFEQHKNEKCKIICRNKKLGRGSAVRMGFEYAIQNNFSMIEINCETDFVAKNNNFIIFSEEISKLAFSKYGKINDILSSKMQNKKNVQDNLVALISKMGEKIL